MTVSGPRYDVLGAAQDVPRGCCHAVHGGGCQDVSQAESNPLPNRLRSDDGRLRSIHGEGKSPVMHDGSVVVGANVIAVGDLLIEVEGFCRVNVSEVDRDEVVAVLTALLVPQPHCVADLVDRVPLGASSSQRNELLTPDHPDRRTAPPSWPERHKIGLGRPRDETDKCVLLPVCDGASYTSLIGESRIDLERNQPTRPAKTDSRDTYPFDYDGPRTFGSSTWLDLGSKLIGRTEYDVSLENCLSIDDGKGNRLLEERVAGDESGAPLRGYPIFSIGHNYLSRF